MNTSADVIADVQAEMARAERHVGVAAEVWNIETTLQRERGGVVDFDVFSALPAQHVYVVLKRRDAEDSFAFR